MAGTHDSSSSMQNQSCNNDLACSNNIRKLYRGVRKRKWGKWVSEIRLPNSRDRIWLGSYDTQLKAARAFDAALYILRGTNACFNFPDTPLNMNINNVVVPRGRSLSPQEIQEVAAKFANYTHTQLETQEEEEEEEEEPLESQSGVDSFGLFESKTTSSGSGYDNYDGKMDWTFLNMLDDDSNAVAGFDCRPDYCELDKTYSSGELLYYTQPPPLEDNNGDETEGNDAFYNHSILWSWDF